MSIKLTAYSHGAGCGCKLSPKVLQEILNGSENRVFEDLLVGNEFSDDAAVHRLDDLTSIISTTDFFMPIVDDPNDFGAIAATNAISDIYAMGGTPMMAVAILGWPIDKLSVEIARHVLEGGRTACHEANIPLAGGHSIDSPEPIFGLAVTGKIRTEYLKTNHSAKVGDLIYLTKPLGVGMVTTAQKKGLADPEDLEIARRSMLSLNKAGEMLADFTSVHAMTDVTGFGLAGHLIEVAESSGVSARIHYSHLPKMSFVDKYLEMGTTPGGTERNWDSYGEKVEMVNTADYRLLADPQTSGGLLITVDPKNSAQIEQLLAKHDLPAQTIGEVIPKCDKAMICI